jgi:glycosidase
MLFVAGCAQPQATAPTPGPTVTPGPTATPIPPVSDVEPFPLATGWWDNAVCYEVFVRSFYDSDSDGIGDLNGLIEKLDYINDGDPNAQGDLGANCIWLMPIAEATSYHGYDVIDYYAVEQDYGTNDDFKRLVAAARERGIRIIIDLVLNHTSVEHAWFQDALNNPASPYRDWYIWSEQNPGYTGPWGEPAWHRAPGRDAYYYGIFWSGMPDLNYRNPAVTEEAHKISRFWLEEMGADGFRLDAIKHLIEDGRIQENTAETHAWLRGYRAFLQEFAPESLTVGEIFDATPTILTDYYPDQLDMYFEFSIGERIISSVRSRNGRQFASAAQRVNDGIPFQRWAPFLTNHDQNRSMTLLGSDFGQAKVAATALLTLPGLSFIYYGEELGMTGAKPDERLRTPMQWSSEAHGGFSAVQPWQALQPNYEQVNVAAQEDDTGSLLNLYRQLVHLHTTQPALSQGDLTTLEVSERAVAAFVRHTEDEAVLVVINFSDQVLASITLTAAQSDLAAGTYRLETLLGDQAAADLTIADGGAITDYMPLSELAAQTGYMFKLRR